MKIPTGGLHIRDKTIELNPIIMNRIEKYLENRRNEIPVLQSHLEKNEFDKIEFCAHNIKGSGAAFGIAEISSIGLNLEAAAKNHNKPLTRGLLIELKEILSEITVY